MTEARPKIATILFTDRAAEAASAELAAGQGPVLRLQALRVDASAARARAW